ncbi:MAG TPA: hypothetical protein DCP32_11905 [Anaerolineaceae bacterium]|nr:hypothetical protein [Anaerolineaceae bacterium]HBA91896.1 hypothetical protein [Anaerolineaceae bacterium]
MSEWEEASPSVIHIAEQLIEKYHPWLRDARIGFVFRDEAQQSLGRLILAQAQKVTAKLQVYLEFDFLIWVSKEDWEGKLTDAQREALIDHELCHCVKRLDTDTWAIRPHDVQEFWQIIERHGLWSSDLHNGREAMERAIQAELPLGQVKRAGKVASVSLKNIGDWGSLHDDLLEEARRFAEEEGEITVTKLQRKFKIAYSRASSLLNLIQTVASEPGE